MSAPFPISDHCDGRRFFNPCQHDDRSWLDVWRWKRSTRPKPWPKTIPAAQVTPPALADSPLVSTWIGHTTFLLQTRAGNVLTDPVYSDQVGPFGIVGPRRAHPPAIPFEDLPAIDVVLLSHDHYDHCDTGTLRRLWRTHAPVAITPLGNGELLRAAGFAPDHVVELDWWQSHALAAQSGRHGGRPSLDLTITLTPARHWSNRLSGPRNGRLWGGFHLMAPGATAMFTGDTAYDDAMFREIRSRLAPVDLAFIPIGAYEPRWFMNAQHCNPAEAVQIHRDLGARLSIGMHWGAFQLTDEGFDDPPRALAQALVDSALPPAEFRACTPGESLFLR